jgi:hypothetical protein
VGTSRRVSDESVVLWASGNVDLAGVYMMTYFIVIS